MLVLDMVTFWSQRRVGMYLGTENNKYVSYPERPWRNSGMIPVDWFIERLPDFIFPPEWIINNSKPYTPGHGPSRGGVYFLISDRRIVYVGVASYIRNRLHTHHCDLRKDFDSVWYFGGIPEIFVEEVESFYIYTLKPSLNRKLPYYLKGMRPFMDTYMEAFGLGDKPDISEYWR